MAMTYAEFQTFLTDMLWRTNDADLLGNLPNLIRMADHELNKKLDIQRREVAASISPETEDYILPADFYQMISLTNRQPELQAGRGDMKQSTLSLIYRMREETNSTHIQPYYYTLRGAAVNVLYLVGPFSAENVGSFELSYRTTVPNYEDENASWLEDEYLDLYTYTIFKHCAIFLREDERISQYAALAADALGSAVDEDKRLVRFGGSPLHMQPHHYVPQTRKRF